MFRYLEENPTVRNSILTIDKKKTRKFIRQFGLNRATAAFVHWMIAKVDAEGANLFFDALYTGANLHETHPILRLRDTLEEWKLRSERRGGKQTDADRQILILKAWNLYAQGKSCQRLFLRANDTLRAPIPRGGVKKVRKTKTKTNGKVKS